MEIVEGEENVTPGNDKIPDQCLCFNKIREIYPFMTEEEINNFLISHSWLIGEKNLSDEVLNDFLKMYFDSLQERFAHLHAQVCKVQLKNQTSPKS